LTNEDDKTGDAQWGYYGSVPQAISTAGWWGGELQFGIGVDDTSRGMTRIPYWGPPATDSNYTYSVLFTPPADPNNPGQPVPLTFDYHDDYYPDNHDTPGYKNDPSIAPLKVDIYTLVPAAPIGLDAVGDRSNPSAPAIDLSWTNTSNIAQQTQIQYQLAGGSWTYLASVPAGVTSYSVTSIGGSPVAFNELYRFRVRSTLGAFQNTLGDSGYSNEADVAIANSAPIVDPIAPVPSNAQNQVTFQVTATDPNGYPLSFTFPNGSSTNQGLTVTENGDGQSATVAGSIPAPPSGIHWYPYVVTIRVSDTSGAYQDVDVEVEDAQPGQNLPIVQSATATQVTGSNTTWSLRAAAVEGTSDPGLTYLWTVIDQPALSPEPRFSVNDTPAAANSTVTFGAPGNYKLRVTAIDAREDSYLGAASGAMDVPVTVIQTPSGLEISPEQTDLKPDGTWQFEVVGLDQFGTPMAVSGPVTWTATSGTFDSGGQGIYTAGSAGGVDIITATVSGLPTAQGFVDVKSGTDQPPIFAENPTVTAGPPVNIGGAMYAPLNLSVWGADDLGESNLTYSWSGSGPGTITWGTTTTGAAINGTNAAKHLWVNVNLGGTYSFTATMTDSFGHTVTNIIPVSIDVPDPNYSPLDSSVVLWPTLTTVGAGVGTVDFTPTVMDQKGNPVEPQPTASDFTWSVIGGSVEGTFADPHSGVYTPPSLASLGSASSVTNTIQVSFDGFTATATIIVVANAKPTVSLVGPPDADAGPWKIDGNTEIDGVVYDPLFDGGTPVVWQLTATPINGGMAMPIDRGLYNVGTAPATGGYLTTLDPSLLPTGAYTLTLTATNGEGQSSQDTHPIIISSGAKVGNMTLPVTDMAIPTGGLPIVISRMYDSTLASRNSDFGYGWRLELPDVDLVTTAIERKDGISDDPQHPALVDGDIVSLTLPGGNVQQFQFAPTTKNGLTTAAFAAIDGNSTLTAWTPGNAPTLSEASTGEYYQGLGTNGIGYNPASATFGGTYYLTTADGTLYTINATSGMVDTVVDTHGNKLDYTNYGGSTGTIVSTPADDPGDPTTITITRDANGHITKITDPQGNSVQYVVNSSGDLTEFTDRVQIMVGDTPTNVTTQYAYGDANLPHFLTSVNDPRGVQVISASYDDGSGALLTLTDANNKTSNITTGPSGTDSTGQTATDLSGNTSQTVTNIYGDVTRQIQNVQDDKGDLAGYLVTVTDYQYSDGERASATQYAPFYVPDTDGSVYSKPGSVPQEVIEYYTSEDTPTGEPDDLDQPHIVTVYGANDTARVTTYSNYASGKPQTISQTLEQMDAGGNVLTSTPIPTGQATYTNGNLTQSTDPLGNVTGYSYDASGHQTSSYRIINGTTVTLTLSTYYGSTNASQGAVAGMLATRTDANGKETFYSYTPNGNVAATWSLSGNGQWVVNETLYDADGRQTSTTQAVYIDASPTQILNVSGFSNGYPAITEAVVQASRTLSATSYNFIGQTDTTTDQYTGVTRYTYDAHGNVIRTLYPNGTEQRIVYDAANRVIWQTDAYPSTTTYNADGSYTNDNTTTANATYIVYDSLGRAVGTQRFSGVLIAMGSATVSGGVSLPTTAIGNEGTPISSTGTVYDEQGRVVERDSASGLRTGTLYYPTGQVQYTGVLLSSAPSNWYTLSNPTQYLDPPIAYTESKYDLFNSTMPAGAAYYDASIQHVFENGVWSTPETDTYYDAVGNVVETQYPDGSFTQTLYGLYGQAIDSSTLASLGITDAPSFTMPAGGQEVVKIAQRKSGDPAAATFYLYDKAGNLTDVWQPAVADALNGGTMTRPHWQYSYLQGQQMTQVDPKGNTTSFAYDALDHELSRTLPDGQTGGSNAGHETEAFTYDQYGNQQTHTDFDGNLTTNTYYTSGVHAGLLETAVYSGASQTTETVNYTYDALNRQTVVTDSANGPTPTTYTYDPVTQNIASITSPEGTINYVYNPATGRDVRMIASHNGTVTDETDYAYDQQGRLIDVYGVVVQGTVYATFAGPDSNGNPTFTGGTPLTTTYTYDPLDNLASETNSDNTKTIDSYDANNRLVGLVTSNTSTGEPIFAESYDLYDNGLRKDVTDTRYNSDGSIFSQTKITWTYDDDQRLTDETLTVLAGGSNAPSAYDDTFKYDLSNNRTEEDITGTENATVTYAYNGDDQLKNETRTGDGAYIITYGYDDNGSLISQAKTVSSTTTTTDYRYDARNRMIRVDTNGDTTYDGNGNPTGNASDDTVYTYDDNGVRVSETANGATTYYLNDPQNPTGYLKAIEESTMLNGSPTRGYILGLNVIAESDSTNDVLYLIKDGHDSTRALLNSSGGVVEQYNYDAFGSLLASVGAQSDASAALTKWLFGGDGIYDASTTWTYQVARWRNGNRFVTYDPLHLWVGDIQNGNPYVYASDNPVVAADPSGMMAEEMLEAEGEGENLDAEGDASAAAVREQAEEVVNELKSVEQEEGVEAESEPGKLNVKYDEDVMKQQVKWYEMYDESGEEQFSARIGEAANGGTKVEISWTNNLPKTRQILTQIQQAEGGSVTEIEGEASDQLLDKINDGEWTADMIARRLSTSLSEDWAVKFVQVGKKLMIMATRSASEL